MTENENKALEYAKRSFESAEKARKHACVSTWAAVVSAIVVLFALFK